MFVMLFLACWLIPEDKYVSVLPHSNANAKILQIPYNYSTEKIIFVTVITQGRMLTFLIWRPTNIILRAEKKLDDWFAVGVGWGF